MSNQDTLPPILSEQSLLIVFGAAFALLVIAGVCITIILKKDPQNIRHFRGGRVLHFLTILTVAAATVMMGLERILTGEAIASILGGIIGYVLGSLKQASEESQDSEFSPIAEIRSALETSQTGLSPNPPPDVHFTHIEYDPLGNDVEGEYIRIKNSGGAAADLTGWTLRDQAGHEFTFPALILKPQASVRVWTKTGANSSHDLYWGRNQAIWNKAGDFAYLRNSVGELVDTYCYHAI